MEFLAGKHALGSLAELACTNGWLKAIAMPILYTTMSIPDLLSFCSKTKGARSLPEGFQFTK